MSVCPIHLDSFYPCNCFDCMSIVLFCEHKVSRVQYCPKCESDKRLSAVCVHNTLWVECFKCLDCCVCEDIGATCVYCSGEDSKAEGSP